MKDNSLFPQVEQLINEQQISLWIPLLSRPIVLDIIRSVLDEQRTEWKKNHSTIEKEYLLQKITSSCRLNQQRHINRVINATGVIIHTNLGRSPISTSVWDKVALLNTRYANVEYDIDSGKRGIRNSTISSLLSHLSHSEGGMVVNNNASALYMVLFHFARGKEVIVSRSELVQIGGGFRIPEIMKDAGAKLVEVGTTNITTANDYLEAISENTAIILKVHRSNFALRGFTKEVGIKELASIIPSHILLISDQGSGMPLNGYPGETSVAQHIKEGADLVTFSGDKVLSSAQSGCIVGKEKYINSLLKCPIYRVLRPGKTILTILEQTLIEYLNGNKGHALDSINRSIEEMLHVANHILKNFETSTFSIVESFMTLGGGSSPDEKSPDISICISSDYSTTEVTRYLRNREIPIITTVDNRGVLLHVSTIFEDEIEIIKQALQEIIEKIPCTS
ncbi:MAG: L-seryl-tRNA(Sec) selenium transferase [Spirochaetia bacterium]|nr:L-seryl-tRNA(Sec) selenium transferase [Spirochaetia bacterium]